MKKIDSISSIYDHGHMSSKQFSLLLDACRHAHVDAVKAYATKHNVNRSDDKYYDRNVTPLFTALSSDDENTLEIVQHLLDLGANPRYRLLGECLLERACSHRYYTDVVKLLIKRGMDVNAISVPYESATTPLITAVREDNREIVNVLLDAGADPFLTVGIPHRSALHVACRENHLYLLSLLCEQIDDPSSIDERVCGQSVMDVAIEKNRLGCVQLLCAYYGAKRPHPHSATSPTVRAWLTRTQYHSTPLHYLDVIDRDFAHRQIRKNPATIHASSLPGGRTPLSIAMEMDAEGLAPKGTAAYEVLSAFKEETQSKILPGKGTTTPDATVQTVGAKTIVETKAHLPRDC